MTDNKQTTAAVPAVNLDCADWARARIIARRRERMASRDYRARRIAAVRSKATTYRARAKRADARAVRLRAAADMYDTQADHLHDGGREGLDGLI